MGANNTKYTYAYIKSVFEENGCLLLSENYVNSNSKLDYICICGSKSSISFSKFKNGQRCRKCGNKKISKSRMLSFEIVKEKIENASYQLLSDKYEGNNKKIQIMCSKGHIYNTTYQSFQIGNRCPVCANNIKKTIDEVRMVFEQANCVLLEEEYINANTKMSYICTCGSESLISFSKFKNGQRCKKCATIKHADKNRLSYEYVCNYINSQGYELVSPRYENIRGKLHLKCDQGHDYHVSFGNFKDNGSRCKICSDINYRTFIDVKEIFAKNDCILLENEFTNSSIPLKYICGCGRESKISLDSFLRGSRCKECGIRKIKDKQKTDFYVVRNEFTKHGYTLLSTEFDFNNNHSKLKYICSCGEEAIATYKSIKNGYLSCKACYLKSISGENNWSYNFNLTEEERISKRKYTEYSDWIKNVYRRDDYTCQCCGVRGVTLNAHHLDGYEWYKPGRTDINNGVTLCEVCHLDFHHVFGYGGNTKEQFEEYMEGVSWNCSGIYSTV